MNKFAISMTAVFALSSLAFLPVASAEVQNPLRDLDADFQFALCDPEGSAIERAACAVSDTVANVLKVAEPITTFANQEIDWAVGVANGVVVFVNQQVTEACSHITGVCKTLEMVETTTLLA